MHCDHQSRRQSGTSLAGTEIAAGVVGTPLINKHRKARQSEFAAGICREAAWRKERPRRQLLGRRALNSRTEWPRGVYGAVDSVKMTGNMITLDAREREATRSA
jgi:4'-phosphopantetheinyl transferase EntD